MRWRWRVGQWMVWVADRSVVGASVVCRYYMSEVKHSEEERPLLSEQKRFPQVFRWKVAAIIISVLIAVFLVVDIILWVHYSNSQPRTINYTFLADLLDQASRQGDAFSTQQFVNMATGLSKSYAELWFQSAALVAAWPTAAYPQLDLDTIGGLFDGDSDHQLIVVTLSDGANSFLGAAYSHIGFPLPSGNWQQFLLDGNTYYTFEILERQSTLVGGGSVDFLRMSGSTANLLNCRVLRLTDTALTLLELFTLDFPPATVTATLAATPTSAACFDGEPTDVAALATLQKLLGVTVTGLSVTKVEAFHLSV